MYSDHPIDGCANDALDRTEFSRMIGDILIAVPLGDGICIGLMGSWGSGKTSIINMVQEYVQAEERKPYVSILRFSPWIFTTTEQLISQFFLQLAEHFDVDESEKSKIGEAITRYASGLEMTALSAALSLTSPLGMLISGIIKKGAEGAGKAVANRAFENKSIQRQKDDIQKLLEESKEKTVIVIDDIDRLTDDQIRCVFQLVTMVCKFPNISYLLAFDRSVVAKALDKFQDNHGDEFLDKVIQVPISVPSIRKNKLFSIMAYYLDELMRLHGIEIHETDQEKWSQLYELCVSRLIKSQRDILRLSNSLRSKLPLVAKDVDFIELVILTIIELREPQLYEWINRHREMLTGQITYDTLHDTGNTDQDKQKRKKHYLEEIKTLLLHKEQYTAENAIDTLCILFPGFSSKVGGHFSNYSDETLRKNNNVGHPYKFDRFFSLNVDNDQITNSELHYLMNEATEEEIAARIVEKDKKHASVELFDEIRARVKTLNKERTKILILGLQAIGDSLKTETSNGLFTRTAPGEAMYLINELFRHLDIKDRYTVLEIMISRMCEANINLTSYIMNRFYLAHDRIFENEEKNTNDVYPNLKSEEELNNIQNKYLTKVREFRDEMNAYRMLEKGLFIHFYRRFEEGKEYLIRTIVSSPDLILYYFHTKATQWHRTGRKETEDIEITGRYRELVTDEQVKQAIQYYIDNGKLAELDLAQQRTIVAYLMKEEHPEEYSGHISVKDIDQRRMQLIKPGENNTQ